MMPFSGVAASGFARTVETSLRARIGFARSAGKTSKSHTFVIVGVLIEIHTEYDLKHTFESANSGCNKKLKLSHNCNGFTISQASGKSLSKCFGDAMMTVVAQIYSLRKCFIASLPPVHHLSASHLILGRTCAAMLMCTRTWQHLDIALQCKVFTLHKLPKLVSLARTWQHLDIASRSTKLISC